MTATRGADDENETENGKKRIMRGEKKGKEDEDTSTSANDRDDRSSGSINLLTPAPLRLLFSTLLCSSSADQLLLLM